MCTTGQGGLLWLLVLCRWLLHLHRRQLWGNGLALHVRVSAVGGPICTTGQGGLLGLLALCRQLLVKGLALLLQVGVVGGKLSTIKSSPGF